MFSNTKGKHTRAKLGQYRLRGVRKRGRQWEARIYKDGKQVCLGFFDTPERAAEAYDRWCFQLHGDRPNERLGLLSGDELKSS